MLPLINENGITVKQLKELVKDLPETNELGDNYEVWITNTEDNRLSSVCKYIYRLNDGDLILQ